MKGPPISIAIIAARTIERRTLLVPPRFVRPFDKPVLSTPITGFIASITTPISSVPSSGKINTGFIPSIDFGSQLNAFLRIRTIIPATKPANSAPRKPDTALSLPVGELSVAPVVAR